MSALKLAPKQKQQNQQYRQKQIKDTSPKNKEIVSIMYSRLIYLNVEFSISELIYHFSNPLQRSLI